jgi:hypothetical protein
MLVAGCGSSTKSGSSGGGGSSSSVAGATSTGSTDTTSSTDCPTTNTKSFAKTRFVSDVGGALFLTNRYVLQPYRAGKFTKGAGGRTVALIKAAAAVAATTKLLKNAQSNAKANPTLCKSVSGPLTRLTNGLSGVVGGLKSGSLSAGALSGIGGLLTSVKSKSGQGGVPVNEQQVPLR